MSSPHLPPTSSPEYTQLQARLQSGWNTHNTRSLLSQVLLPYGLCLNLGIHERFSGMHVREFLVGRPDQREERVTLLNRSFDGFFTELEIHWRNVRFRVQTLGDGEDLTVRVLPLSEGCKMARLVGEVGVLWNRPGHTAWREDHVEAVFGEKRFRFFSNRPQVEKVFLNTCSPCLVADLSEPVVFSTRGVVDAAELEAEIDRRRRTVSALPPGLEGELAEAFDAIRLPMAWNSIYDDENERVISPVSRLWNNGWGGWVLFDWDTYFAATMAAGTGSRDLAYANVVEISREAKRCGFVPNFASADDHRGYDRSQPPVGSMTVLGLYRAHGDRWLLEEVFGDLLTWNRWFDTNRNIDGYLCWGTNPFEVSGRSGHKPWRTIHNALGAARESGLDNSPMYEEMPFDPERNCMVLADVGLISLYILDCQCLATIARELGREEEALELTERAATHTRQLQTLWDEEAGLFLNRRLDTGEPQRRLSPTHFYPLLAGVPTPGQARRMMDEHYFNPGEFAGEWILPSIARNDPLYEKQHYWQGRVWAPMNYLVYLGLCRYELPDVRTELADKSLKLLLKEWREHRHIHENYNANTGEGCDSPSSDSFYHWGALLGVVALMERGLWSGGK